MNIYIEDEALDAAYLDQQDAQWRRDHPVLLWAYRGLALAISTGVIYLFLWGALEGWKHVGF